MVVTVYCVLSTGCYRNVFDLGSKNDYLQKAGTSTGVLVERGGRRMGVGGEGGQNPTGQKPLVLPSSLLGPLIFYVSSLLFHTCSLGFPLKVKGAGLLSVIQTPCSLRPPLQGLGSVWSVRVHTPRQAVPSTEGRLGASQQLPLVGSQADAGGVGEAEGPPSALQRVHPASH